MKKASLLNNYLDRYASSPHWKLCAVSLEDINQVVVIPAYAEVEMLFDTIASVAENPETSLNKTMVICVINNKADASDAVRENNLKTLKLLSSLTERRSFNGLNVDNMNHGSLEKIGASRIRLGYIDASSPGLEIPKKVGGVGMARKIGMDTALRILQSSNDEMKLIMSLDADTLVKSDYLTTIRRVFFQKKINTGILSYEHQLPSDGVGRSAICAYEIFLRYWVWGLKYAESPFAFHSIGSTIVTTSDAYLSVRGMNRREAGEDFYFLNKLAKVSPVHTIEDTVVYPSARISARVPFGTGAAVEKITACRNQEYRLYDPQVFMILKMWLECLKTSFPCSVAQIIAKAKNIHEGLAHFLIERKFTWVWPKIRDNIKNPGNYERHVHNWFDGFETLKLINYLTREYYPKIHMHKALEKITDLQDCKSRIAFPPDDYLEMLKVMRTQSRSETSAVRSTRG